MLIVKNISTGEAFRGHLADQAQTAEFNLAVDQTAAVNPGDTLQLADRIYLSISRRLVRPRLGGAYLAVTALRADQLATISRAGQPVATVECHVSKPQLPIDQFGQYLTDSTPAGSALRATAEAIEALLQARQLLDGDEAEQPLLDAIARKLDRHQAALRIITRAGSGAAVGDVVTIKDHAPVIVAAVDRTSWPGLEVWICDPAAPAPKKSTIFSRLKGA